MCKNELLQTWRERLEDCAQSEMTVQDWCDFNRLPVHQYYYWRRKLLRTDVACTPSLPTSWIPVDLLAPSASADWADTASTLTLHVALGTPGAEIAIRSGFDPSLLRAVVQALGGRPC